MENKGKNFLFLSLSAVGLLGMAGLVSAPQEQAAAAQEQAQPQITEIAATDIEAPPAVQDIIRRQLAAIKVRDADLAFSLMTDESHRKFDDASNFLSHMRFEYRSIYNFENITFLDGHSVDGGILQKARIEDHYGGDPVTVIFRLERQQDGRWLIDSFTVLDGEAQPI